MNKSIISIDKVSLPSERRGYPLEETVISFIEAEAPYVLGENDEPGDYEDFYENYLRLFYSSQVLPHDSIIVNVEGEYYDFISKRRIDNYKTIEGSSKGKFYGAKAEWDILETEDEGLHAYGNQSTFYAYANRFAVKCGFPDDDGVTVLPDELNVFNLIRKAREELAIERFVIKSMKAKHGLYFIDFSGVENTVESIEKHIVDWFKASGDYYGFYRVATGNPTYILQEHKPMKYEYRMFIVDGVIVSGAGCIEAHTPLVNTKRFNTLVEYERNDGMIVDEPYIVDRLIGYADEIVTHTNYHYPEVQTYVVDVYLYEDGSLGMIERNGFSNSGFYGNDLKAIVSAYFNK